MNPPRAVEENRSTLDRELDETLEASFPASDAAANTVVTGNHIVPAPPLPLVSDKRQASQFELVVDGQAAVLTYERTPTSLVLLHTDVPPSLRGRHLGDALAKAAIDAAHAERLRLVVVCPFVKAYLRCADSRTATQRIGKVLIRVELPRRRAEFTRLAESAGLRPATLETPRGVPAPV